MNIKHINLIVLLLFNSFFLYSMQKKRMNFIDEANSKELYTRKLPIDAIHAYIQKREADSCSRNKKRSMQEFITCTLAGCGFTTTDQEIFQLHFDKHLSSLAHTCTLCGKVLFNKKYLSRHRKSLACTAICNSIRQRMSIDSLVSLDE